MIRTFATHKIRKTQEISSCLWDFCTLPEQGKEEADDRKKPHQAAEQGDHNGEDK